jgi:phage gp36-like protein
MAYCEYTDLVERFGVQELDQLTEHAGDCPAIQSAIGDAGAEIDAYLANRYTVPLTSPVPFVIRRCACDIARYFLWDTQSTEHVRERYTDAIALLKSVANGSLDLGVSPNVIASTAMSVAFESANQSAWGRRDNYHSRNRW